MNDLVELTRGSAPAVFQPSEARTTMAKIEVVLDFAKKLGDWPLTKEAAGNLIVYQKQIAKWWRENVTPLHSLGRGKKNVDTPFFSVAEAQKKVGFSQQQISKWRNRMAAPDDVEAEEPAYPEQLARAGRFGIYRDATELDPTTKTLKEHFTGEIEWYTPANILAAVKQVFSGEIDLDPASSEEAQKLVQAKAYFTQLDDGLKHEWHGRVFMNPPYHRDLIAKFIDKFTSEVAKGHIKQGIILTHGFTDPGWFHTAVKFADAVCFTRGRISFYNSLGEAKSPTTGSTFFYYGNDVPLFRTVFAQFGLGFVTRDSWEYEGEDVNDREEAAA